MIPSINISQLTNELHETNNSIDNCKNNIQTLLSHNNLTGLRNKLTLLVAYRDLLADFSKLSNDFQVATDLNLCITKNNSYCSDIAKYNDKKKNLICASTKYNRIVDDLVIYSDKHLHFSDAVSKLDALIQYKHMFIEFSEYKNDLANYNFNKDEMFRLFCEVTNEEKNIESYIQCKHDYFSLLREQDILLFYEKLISPNGVQNFILQDFIPHIRDYANDFLNNCADFSINIVSKRQHIYETSSKNDGTVDVLLIRKPSDSVNTIVDIEHELSSGGDPVNSILDNTSGHPSYDMLSGSGYESFIASLAIRYALGLISRSTKPNFFIIDEGFGCLDADNLENIGKPLEYLSTQYDHLIVISHINLSDSIPNRITINHDPSTNTSTINNSI